MDIRIADLEVNPGISHGVEEMMEVEEATEIGVEREIATISEVRRSKVMMGSIGIATLNEATLVIRSEGQISSKIQTRTSNRKGGDSMVTVTTGINRIKETILRRS